MDYLEEVITMEFLIFNFSKNVKETYRLPTRENLCSG